MANTIRLKKRASGGASGAPSSLAPSEPAFSEVDSILYYGFGDAGNGSSSSVVAIAGSGAFTTLTGTQTISGDKTFTGTVDLSGATLSGNTTFSNNLIVSGDLTVNGTTTTIDTETLDVKDKNITLGDVSTPSDTTADGGGITLLGATNKTINWINSTDCWTSNQDFDLVSGKDYKIAGTSVLSGSTLGSGVTGSSLTSVGTIGTGVWQGTTIGRAYGGTGLTSAPANGELLIGNGSGYALSTLTAGNNITITEGSGSITIAATGGTAFSAGNGIDVTGSTISVDRKANGGLVFETTQLAIDLGASAITGTLAVGDGGTGATTLTGILKGNGTSAFTVATAGTDYLSDSSTVDGGTF
jgi:cytoskeletal protein CcmA (bactofilin family)